MNGFADGAIGKNRLGGTIDIISQPGLGTAVRLLFPRIPTPMQEKVLDPPGPAPCAMTIYLVDDDEEVRFLMTRLLKKAGVRKVKAFSGGAAVLESLGIGELPDLIILDQNMPGMNGTQTMERIRRLHPGMPILISSGQPDIEELECYRQAKVSAISKPFTLEEIQAKLAQFAQENIPASKAAPGC